jgi:hypothetical protein
MSLIESTAVSIDFNLPSIDDTSCNNIFKITGVLVLRFKVSETVKSQRHVETSCQVLSDMFDDVKNKSDKRDDLINKHTEQFVKHSQDISIVLHRATLQVKNSVL